MEKNLSTLLEEWQTSSITSDEVEALVRISEENPENFWKSLQNILKSKFGLKSNSLIFEHYDFYNDCVIRHLNQNLTALKLFKDGQCVEVTYDRLHGLVNYQVNRWRNQITDCNGNVAIVMPIGINFLVGILAAFRLGLRISVLPLDSPLLPIKRIRHFLDVLKLEMIITTPEVSPYIPGKERHWLIEYLEESEYYDHERDLFLEPKDLVQYAVCCHTQGGPTLVPVLAEEMYLNAMRAGYFIFKLKPGKIWGYTPDCSLREQPFLFFTSLFFGATTVIIDELQLQENPDLVSRQPIELLGISCFSKNFWLEQDGLPNTRLQHWYYNLVDDDKKSWNRLAIKNHIDQKDSTHLLIDNAYGGILFSSVKVADEKNDPMWPPLGVNWNLLQSNLPEVSSVHTYGIFKLETASDLSTNFMLNKLNVGWQVISTVTPNQRGYSVPHQELEKSIEELEFVDYAVVLTLLKTNSIIRTDIVLLIFIDPLLDHELSSKEAEWREQILSKIRQEFGSPFLPDKIVIFPLTPMVENDQLDREWCIYQYKNGLLARKMSFKIYHWLSLLKRWGIQNI